MYTAPKHNQEKKYLPQSWKWISDQHTMRFPRLFPLRKKCRCKNKLVSFLLSSFHLKCNPSVMCVLFVSLGYIGSLISSVKLNGLLSVRKKEKPCRCKNSDFEFTDPFQSASNAAYKEEDASWFILMWETKNLECSKRNKGKSSTQSVLGFCLGKVFHFSAFCIRTRTRFILKGNLFNLKEH